MSNALVRRGAQAHAHALEHPADDQYSSAQFIAHRCAFLVAQHVRCVPDLLTSVRFVSSPDSQRTDRWLFCAQRGQKRRCPMCNTDPLHGLVLHANPRHASPRAVHPTSRPTSNSTSPQALRAAGDLETGAYRIEMSGDAASTAAESSPPGSLPGSPLGFERRLSSTASRHSPSAASSSSSAAASPAASVVMPSVWAERRRWAWLVITGARPYNETEQPSPSQSV